MLTRKMLLALLLLLELSRVDMQQLSTPSLTSTPSIPQLGQNLTLTCSVPSSVSVATFQWQKNFNVIADVSGSTLSFNPVSTTDSGLYRCTYYISNGQQSFGSNQYEIAVSVPDAPNLKSNKPGPYIVSSYVYLTCDTKYNNVGAYNFYKNGVLKVTQSWNTYNLDSSKDDFFGNYTCTGSNSNGESAHSNSLLLIILRPPTLISTNDDPQIGDDVTLTCQLPIQVVGIKFTWFKGNNLLTNATEQVYTLTNIKADDAGEFKCSFDINEVRGLQSSGFIIVFTPPEKPLLSLPSGSSVNVGSSFSFQCNANDSLKFGLLKVFLYQNGVKVAERNGSFGYARFFLQRTLMRDSGNYTCTFTNKRGESVYSDPGSVMVKDAQVGNSSLPQAPQIMFRGEYSQVSLYCSPATYGETNYCSFYINGIRYVDDQDCSVYLPHSVGGSYTCTRNIYNKTGLMSPQVQVTFYNKPRVLPTTISILNQNFALRCITDVPSGTYFWYNWDNLVYSSNNDTYEFTLTSSMAGSYRCRVKMNETEIWSEFYPISVSRPPKPSLDNYNRDSGFSFNENNSTTLYCYAGDAETYALYKNGIKVSTKQSSNNLFTVVLSDSETVMYTCTASNRLGESEKSEPVYLGKKETVHITASSEVASVGQPFSMNCSAKNNQSSGSYTWEIHKTAWINTLIPSQNLTFNPLTQQDEGVYICEFTKQESTAKARDYYVLAVSLPSVPEITLRNQAGRGEQGSRYSRAVGGATVAEADNIIVYFDCYTDTLLINARNPFRLYKNGAVVKNVPYVDELYFSGKFSIQRVYSVDTNTVSNEGNYTCTALNSVGESQPSKAVYITRSLGFMKPQVTMNNTNPQAGDDITLTCNILTPQPNFIITWQKDFSNILKTGPTLSLKSLTVEDHGFYTCCYLNRSNEDYRYNCLEKVSDPIFISLLPPLQPILLFDANYLDLKNKYYPYGGGPVFYTFGEGETIHLNCFVQVMHINDYQISSTNQSPYNFTLYKNRQITQPANTNGMFTISGLTKGDYNYTCQVSREAQQSFMSYPLLVKITDRPTITSSVPSPSLGANLTLTCNTLVESNSIEITWRKNGINMGFTSNVLSLNTISQYDEGSYTCQQTNMEWTTPMSSEFIINFGLSPSKPQIFITANTPIQAGSSFAIYCLSTGSPVVSATFYKDGQIIFKATGGYISDAGQTVFTYQISLAAATNSGIYSCTVRNSLSVSQISESLNLNVIDDIGCSPGFYISVTGNCQPCPFGSYQSNSNQMDCVPCPGNLFTLVRAASDIALCEAVPAEKLLYLRITINKTYSSLFDAETKEAVKTNLNDRFLYIKNVVGVLIYNISSGADVDETAITAALVASTGVHSNMYNSVGAEIYRKYYNTPTTIYISGQSVTVKTVNMFKSESDSSNFVNPIDIDECSLTLRPCSPYESCDNINGVIGSFTCTCITGFQRSTLLSPCSDVNECRQPNLCTGSFEQCKNSVGSYTCDCIDGYTRRAPQDPCSNINECSSNPCTSNKICNNSIGSYTCNCPMGYSLAATGNCVDVDECATVKPCHQKCTNNPGGYTCSCYDTFTMTSNGTCTLIYSKVLELKFPLFVPPDILFVNNSEEYKAIIKELQGAMKNQLSKMVTGFLDFVVKNIRKGSLIVVAEAIIDKSVNTNPAGEFIKALTKLNMDLVTVNGTYQINATITIDNFVITNEVSQCEARSKVDPCSDDEICVTASDGVAVCKQYIEKETTDKQIGIGVGVGVGGLIIIAIIATLVVRHKLKSRKYQAAV